MIFKKTCKIVLVAFLLTLGFIGINKSDVKAAKRTEVYLEVGETYTQSFSKVSGAILYKYGDEDKAVVTASTTSTKLTLKAKGTGSATLYVNKNSKKNDANIVRTVKVHVYAESSNMTPNINNNVSTGANDDSYTNKTIKSYQGRNFNVGVAHASLPNSVANDTSGKAKEYQLSSIFECANMNGDIIKNSADFLLTPTGNTTRTRSYRAAKVGTTYMYGCIKWVSSNGTTHWTKIRVVPVNVYPCPAVSVFEDGKQITKINCIIGEERRTTVSVKNMLSSDTIEDISCVSQDPSKADFEYDEDIGGFIITPKSVTNTAVWLTYTIEINNPLLTPYNGEAYTTFIYRIQMNIGKLTSPTINNIRTVSNGIRLDYNFVKGASSYKVYRANTLNGEYKEIGVSTENYFVDKDADYGKTYFYKMTTLGKDGEHESAFSEIKSQKRIVLTPSISKVKKVSGGLYQIIISSSGASGYEIYHQNSLLMISKAKTTTLKLSNKVYSFRVRAYVTNDSSKKIYSDYSSYFIYDAVTDKVISSGSSSKVKKPKKTKIKKIKKSKKKLSIKVKKIKGVSGYNLRYSKSKRFKKYKSKNSKKPLFKIKRMKKLYLKVRTYIKKNHKKYYSKWSKRKKVK